LWELLAYHHLDDQVAIGIDKSKLLLARYERPDPELETFNQAARLVGEVDSMIGGKKYAEAVDKCQEAINICPGYSKAYMTRAVLYTIYNVDRFPGGVAVGNPVNEEQLKYANYALDDAKTYLQMNPNNAEAYLLLCMKSIDVDIIRQVYSAKRHEVALEVTTKIIEDPSVSRILKARAYTARAAVKTNVQDNYEYADEIYADYDAAIRLDPFNSRLWRNRASYDRTGTDAEEADNRRAQDLDDAEAAAGDAWYLATARDDKVRDGHKAWELAGKACQTTNYKHPSYLGALAAAYAECGDFEQAVDYAKKAIDLADGDEKDRLEAQLKLYEEKKPFRQPAE
jgi:tetratricopeptide (TPR) repeat protein